MSNEQCTDIDDKRKGSEVYGSAQRVLFAYSALLILFRDIYVKQDY